MQGEPSDRDAGLPPSLPAQQPGITPQRLPVRGGALGEWQLLVRLSCFIISWLSMPPISPKSNLGWKAETAPAGGCWPAILLKEGLNVVSQCPPLQKRATLPSGIGSPGISTPTPTGPG